MDRRDLLRGLLAVPIANALSGPQHQPGAARRHGPHAGRGTLKVVIDGSFAIVLQTNSRSRVRAFTPRDPDNKHKFYFFDQREQLRSAHPLESRSTERPYHFELLPRGLKVQSKPEIDIGLADFTASTDRWCQEDYLVTIDLPCPRKITFMPPQRSVIFKNGRREGCISYNHILEYEITDRARVTMAWQDVKEFHPVPCADLVKRYQNACQELSENERAATPPCSEQKMYSSFFGNSDVAFFFGIGLPGGDPDYEHPIRFFNESILASFPHLKSKLEIASLGQVTSCKQQAHSLRAALVPATLTQRMPRPQLIEVSSVVDCKVSGPVVTFPG